MKSQITFPDWVAEQEAAGTAKPVLAENVLKITITSLYRYLAGDRVPDRDVMMRIVEASAGRVNPGWFFEANAAKRANSAEPAA